MCDIVLHGFNYFEGMFDVYRIITETTVVVEGRNTIEQTSCTVQTNTPEGPDTWLTLDQWTTPTTKAHRNTELAAAGRAHGWTIAGATQARNQTLTATPLDWPTILDRAGARKQQSEAAATASNQAWRQAVLNAPKFGEDGYMPSTWIGERAGVTKHIVHRVIRETNRS